MGTKRCARLTAAQKIERALILATIAGEADVAGVQLSDHESVLLHDRVASFVCSWRWEQDLVHLVNAGEVPLHTRRHDQVLAFSKTGYYPPGGAETAMQICTACKCPMPPNIFGSRGICYECYQLQLDEGPSAMQPSSARFVWMVADKRALALLGEGFQLKRSRARRRPLFLRDDPRVSGGKIDADGVLHDPWLGESGPPSAVELAIAVA